MRICHNPVTRPQPDKLAKVFERMDSRSAATTIRFISSVWKKPRRRWQEIVQASGFEHVASIGTETDSRELELGPSLYGNPYAWHILSR